MKKIISIAFKSTAAYVIAQLLTGVESGALAAYLFIARDMTLSEALAISIPISYPLMIVQMILVYLIINRYSNDSQGSDDKSTDMEVPDSHTSLSDN